MVAPHDGSQIHVVNFINGLFCKLLHVCLYRVETKSSRLFSKVKQRQPVSTWIGERLTLLGVVDFSCVFFFFFLFFCFFLFVFFFACSVFCFSFFFVILLSLSNKSVCICSADAFSYPMTCLGYVFAVNGKII